MSPWVSAPHERKRNVDGWTNAPNFNENGNARDLILLPERSRALFAIADSDWLDQTKPESGFSVNRLRLQEEADLADNQITLTGDDGVARAFWIHPLFTTFKAVGGVYCFAAEGGDRYTIIYVGETDNLRRRITDDLLAHHRYQCAVSRGATHFFTMQVDNYAHRLQIEGALRRQYDPACNRQ